MIRFFITTLLVISAVAAGWYYTPANVKAQILGFVGIAASRREIKNFIEDVVLPADPEERREILVQELKKNVGELKRRAVQGGAIEAGVAVAREDAASPALAKAKTEEVIGASEKLLDELRQANDDKSVGGTIIERIIDRVLPATQEIVCKDK